MSAVWLLRSMEERDRKMEMQILPTSEEVQQIVKQAAREREQIEKAAGTYSTTSKASATCKGARCGERARRHVRPRLMICGHGRHGKDTVADYFCRFADMKKISSSWAVAKLFFESSGEYENVAECYEDRANRRSDWHDFIKAYNTPDLAKLAREIYRTSDIYVGIRSAEEFFACREEGLFDLSIWVDGSKRHPPESLDSNRIAPWMCDIVLDNNGAESALAGRIYRLCLAMGLTGGSESQVQVDH